MIRGDGDYCAYCKRELIAYTATHPTRDHIMPKSKGGRKTVWACKLCNGVKADMLPDEWNWFMRQFPEWWKAPNGSAGREALAARRVGATTVPKVYDDPRMQAGLEHAYRGREYLLTETN